MKIENSFEVPADPDATFGLLTDLERVGSCVPGGEVGPASPDGSHPVAVVVKLGPMKMNYAGTARIEERDDAADRAVLVAEVKEKRGQGAAKATMEMRVEAGAGGSRVVTETDLALTGRAAQMGRGVVEDVAERLVTDMTGCIARQLAPPEEATPPGEGSVPEPAVPAGEPERAKPIGGIRLLLRVLWSRIKRLFARLTGRSSR